MTIYPLRPDYSYIGPAIRCSIIKALPKGEGAIALDPSSVPLLIHEVKETMRSARIDRFTQFILDLVTIDRAALEERFTALRKDALFALLPPGNPGDLLKLETGGEPLLKLLLGRLEEGKEGEWEALISRAVKGEGLLHLRNGHELEEALYDKAAMTMTIPSYAMHDIADEKLRIALLKKIRDVSGNIKNSRITDERVRIAFARCAAASSITCFIDYVQEYDITDQGVLKELAMIAAVANPARMAVRLQNFGLRDKKDITEVVRVIAESGPTAISHYIQNYGITDQKALFAIALAEVTHYNPKISCEGRVLLQNYGLTDPHEIIILAQMAAKLPHSGLSSYIHTLGITDYAVRLAIAKEAVITEGPTFMKYVANYQLTEEDACEMVRTLAVHTPEGLSENITNFAIKNEAVLREVAASIRGRDSTMPAHIAQFGLHDQVLLETIATACARAFPRELALHIGNFNIRDEARRAVLARDLMTANPSLCLFIVHFKLTDEKLVTELAVAIARVRSKTSNLSSALSYFGKIDYEGRLSIARDEIQSNPTNFNKNVRAYDLNESDAIAMVQILLETSPSQLPSLINTFPIRDERALGEIALRLAGIDHTLSDNIQNFHLTDQAVLGAIATKAAAFSPQAFSKNVKKFDLKDDALRGALAKEVARSVNVSFTIANFELSDQKILVEIALQEIERGGRIGACFRNYNITDYAGRLAIAKKEATYDGGFRIRDYDLTEPDRIEVARILVQHDPKTLFAAKSDFAIRDPLVWKELACSAFIYKLIGNEVDNEDHSQLFPDHPTLFKGRPAEKALMGYAYYRLRDRLDRPLEEVIITIARYRNLSLASTLMQTFCSLENKKEYLERASPNHLRLPMVYLVSWGVKAPRFTDYLKRHRSDLRNAQSGSMQLVIKTLQAMDSLPLNKELILEKCSEGEGVLEKLALVQALCLMKKIPDMTGDLAGQVIQVFKETGVLNLEGIADFDARFMKSFANLRVPNGLFIYLSRLQCLKDPVLQPAMTRCIRSVLEGHFPAIRYQKEASRHLARLPPELLKEWQKAAPKRSLDFESKQDKALPTFADFLAEQRAHHHMIHEGRDVVEGTEAEALCTALGKEKLTIERLEELRDKLSDCEFRVHVGDLISTLKAKSETALTIEETDDFQDLFFSGTEVLGSCQRIDGDPCFNKGLLAYVMDGKIRMIAIKNGRGKIVARFFLKLLFASDGAIVLYQERIYPPCCAPALEEALNSYAIRRAAELHLPLYSDEGTGLSVTLSSLGCPAPYEYVDARRLGIKHGEYAFWAREVVV